MKVYQLYATEALLELQAKQISEYTNLYFESANTKTLKLLKAEIFQVRKELNSRIRDEVNKSLESEAAFSQQAY